MDTIFAATAAWAHDARDILARLVKHGAVWHALVAAETVQFRSGVCHFSLDPPV
jgi:hypothetical protein